MGEVSKTGTGRAHPPGLIRQVRLFSAGHDELQMESSCAPKEGGKIWGTTGNLNNTLYRTKTFSLWNYTLWLPPTPRGPSLKIKMNKEESKNDVGDAYCWDDDDSLCRVMLQNVFNDSSISVLEQTQTNVSSLLLSPFSRIFITRFSFILSPIILLIPIHIISPWGSAELLNTVGRIPV